MGTNFTEIQQNTTIFCQDNAFKDVISKMAAILFTGFNVLNARLQSLHFGFKKL